MSVRRDIYATSNTNGTNGPKRWKITGNRFGKQVQIEGNGPGGSSGDAEDVHITNNSFSAAATLVFGGTASRAVESGNIFEASGAHAGRFTSLTSANSFNVRGAAMARFSGTGSITFNVTGLETLTGSNWRATSILCFLGGISPDASNGTANVFMLNLNGVGAWALASVSDIIGTATVSSSASTTTGCTITVTLPAGSTIGNLVAILAGQSINSGLA